MIRSFEKSTMR